MCSSLYYLPHVISLTVCLVYEAPTILTNRQCTLLYFFQRCLSPYDLLKIFLFSVCLPQLECDSVMIVVSPVVFSAQKNAWHRVDV